MEQGDPARRADRLQVDAEPDSSLVQHLRLNSRSNESFRTGMRPRPRMSHPSSLQSLFVPPRNRSNHDGSKSTIGSKKSVRSVVSNHVELQLLSPEEEEADTEEESEEDKKFKAYETAHYLHSLAASGNIEGLQKAFEDVDDLKTLTATDHENRTILHCAANFHGNGKEIIRVILDKYKELVVEEVQDQSQWSVCFSSFVNATDFCFLTALYLAAKRENLKICKELLLNNADWDIKSNRDKSPIQKMFKKIPLLIKKTLLKFATQSTMYVDKQETIVRLDFAPIIGYPSSEENEIDSNWAYEEAHLLSNLRLTKQDDRKPILNHILVKIFIWLKWRKFKYCFSIIVLLPILRLLIYFWFLIRVYRKDCPYPTDQNIPFNWEDLRPGKPPKNDKNMTGTDTGSEFTTDYHECYKTVMVTGLAWFLLIMSLCDLLFFDIYPTFIKFHRYWYPMKTRNLRKYVKRGFLFLKKLAPSQFIEFLVILVNILPALGWPIIPSGNKWQYIIASFGVFLAWFHIFHQLGRIPPLRVYVDMFSQILHTLVNVSFMYGAIIFAFAMVFCILLPGVGSYSSLTQALMKMSTFLIGEIEYEDIFYSEESEQISVSLRTTMVFYVMAILVLHVALLNFLVGLTVNDIQRIYADSAVFEDFSKLWQISLIETLLSGAPCKMGVPFLKFLRIQTGYKIADTEGYVLEIPMYLIPKHYQKELRGLLTKQKMKLKFKKDVVNYQNQNAAPTEEGETETTS